MDRDIIPRYQIKLNLKEVKMKRKKLIVIGVL